MSAAHAFWALTLIVIALAAGVAWLIWRTIIRDGASSGHDGEGA
jgi:hypothetical protein